MWIESEGRVFKKVKNGRSEIAVSCLSSFGTKYKNLEQLRHRQKVSCFFLSDLIRLYDFHRLFSLPTAYLHLCLYLQRKSSKAVTYYNFMQTKNNEG